jgi:hypothetical protein
MSEHSEQPITYSGPLIAASMAPLLAFFTLMVSHHISRLSKELDKAVHAYGYWIPGSTGSGPEGSIGSYSGKETLALSVWLISWLVLHLVWRRQNLSVASWSRIFVIGLALITIGFFHPLADPVVLMIAGLLGIH